MRILVTGGTGFVGRRLCPRLAAAGHEIVVLSRRANARVDGVTRVVTKLDALEPDGFDAAINLAGEPIGDARWTPERKRLLLDSRLGVTRAVVDWIGRAQRRPATLVSASAVGWYGDQGDRVLTEDTAPVAGFTHDLCAAWEREARRAEAHGTRVCVARIGVVLDRDGGALAKMLPAFRLGGGGPLGPGRQWFPWLHRDDMAGILQWLVETESARGVYNASAPNPVTNAEFTRELGRALHRPAVLPVPGFALKALFGEMSELLLMSDRMVPKRLLDEGFPFRYPTLAPALAAIFAG
ncbi:MAG: TIGR01777 family oxidoreductase [Pseudomonadota bacterium]